MSRKITLFNSNSQVRKEVMTNATTWGQLKSENVDFITANLRGMVRETRVSLEHDDAQLPSGESVIFLATKEIKSGK
jgi:hypothetical protein